MCQKMYYVDVGKGAKVEHLWEFILRPVGNFQQCQEYDAGGLGSTFMQFESTTSRAWYSEAAAV